MTMKDFRLSHAFRQACRDDVQQHCIQYTKKYVVVVSVVVVVVVVVVVAVVVVVHMQFCW